MGRKHVWRITSLTGCFLANPNPTRRSWAAEDWGTTVSLSLLVWRHKTTLHFHQWSFQYLFSVVEYVYLQLLFLSILPAFLWIVFWRVCCQRGRVSQQLLSAAGHRGFPWRGERHTNKRKRGKQWNRDKKKGEDGFWHTSFNTITKPSWMTTCKKMNCQQWQQ